MDWAKKTGYSFGFGQHSGAFNLYSNQYYLPRFPSSGRFADFEYMRVRFNTLPLPIRDFLPKNPVLDNTLPNIGFSIVEKINNVFRCSFKVFTQFFVLCGNSNWACI